MGAIRIEKSETWIEQQKRNKQTGNDYGEHLFL